MATKKPVNKTPHFHIPADPLRVKSEEIRARSLDRKKQGLRAAKGVQENAVTLETLYSMLTDVLERQEILEQWIRKNVK
ncbi:hypothetical protein NYE70_13620 [Paenibacillus sp. FSL R5-0407]|uniref:hypothetical protein n=1 Tax=Paenibacillus sp. FSL R5-0407 TaxID=2975320 RepID=UPI0030FAB009